MDERRMIFSNLLNKVPIETLAQVFHKTENEIMLDFKYITQKVKNYCFKNNVPAIYCDSLEQARKNRHAIFAILPLLNLQKPAEFNVRHEPLVGANSMGSM